MISCRGNGVTLKLPVISKLPEIIAEPVYGKAPIPDVPEVPVPPLLLTAYADTGTWSKNLIFAIVWGYVFYKYYIIYIYYNFILNFFCYYSILSYNTIIKLRSHFSFYRKYKFCFFCIFYNTI